MDVKLILLGCLCASSIVRVESSDDICEVDEWTEWTTCSQSCGGGIQERDGLQEGTLCTSQEANCKDLPCDDPWFSEVQWSGCSVTCGGGTRSRTVNGVKQTQEIRCNTHSCLEKTNDCIGDVAFSIDSSNSIGSLNWMISLQFVIDVMKGLKVSEDGTHVSVVTFSNEAETHLDLNEYYSMTHIENIVFDLDYLAGLTNTADGIRAISEAIDEHGRPSVKKIAVVVADGASTLNQQRTIPEAQSAKDAGIKIFFVAIGDEVDMAEINSISSGSRYIFIASDFNAVQDLTDQIANEICRDPEPVDCSRCDFTNGQVWLQDPDNCHMYYICEFRHGHAFKHHMTCGDLYWNQPYHTCVPVKPADAACDEGDIVTYRPKPTQIDECPYKPYPGDPTKYWIQGNDMTIKECEETMMFFNVENLCNCVPISGVTTCSDDLLLHFPYEDHYNDVTCHHAIATQYGNGVSIQDDDQRGKVACFTGHTHFEVAFMRTWFANNEVDKFTITVFYKRTGVHTSSQAIVSNGDCKQTRAYSLVTTGDGISASITTEQTNFQTLTGSSPGNAWHHAAWVYDGVDLLLYLDKAPTPTTIPITGYLSNNDVPMMIAGCCGGQFFIGCLDELRVYDRVLTFAEILPLDELSP